RGLEGLRIADASVFPTIPSVNLCMTAIMVGERAAAFVVADAAAQVAIDVPRRRAIAGRPEPILSRPWPSPPSIPLASSPTSRSCAP
ncbi:MAG: GMC oxidoreductase, partial [Actinomycetota bacterium]